LNRVNQLYPLAKTVCGFLFSQARRASRGDQRASRSAVFDVTEPVPIERRHRVQKNTSSSVLDRNMWPYGDPVPSRDRIAREPLNRSCPVRFRVSDSNGGKA